VRRLLALERQTLELIKKFPPPPSVLPDTVERLVGDLGLAVSLIVLHHEERLSDTSDRLQEVLKSIGLPEMLKTDFNAPGVADAFVKDFHERTLTALRALVETRGAKRSNDPSNASFTVELGPLYSKIPTKLKNEYGLPTELAEFSRRAAALFGDKLSEYKQKEGAASSLLFLLERSEN
jgi:hypothetical protein